MKSITKNPTYQIQMIGDKALRIIMDGKDLGVFDKRSLGEEFSKTLVTGDLDRRYVIDRALETLEGKIPKVYKRSRSRLGGAFVPIYSPRALKRDPIGFAPPIFPRRRPRISTIEIFLALLPTLAIMAALDSLHVPGSYAAIIIPLVFFGAIYGIKLLEGGKGKGRNPGPRASRRSRF